MRVFAGSHPDGVLRGRSDSDRTARRKLPYAVLVFIAASLAFLVGIVLEDALQSPVERIRSELQAVASDLQSSESLPRPALLRAVQRNFRGQRVTIDANSWPNVAVTFHGLDAPTCREAAAKIRRIDGLVVIVLERHHDAARACGAANDLTWRIMP